MNDIVINATGHNTYEYTLEHVDGTKRVYKSTNATTPLFTKFLARGYVPSYLHIGSGTGTVPNSTNKLFAPKLAVYSTSSVGEALSMTPICSRFKVVKTFVLSGTAYVGNITEVGIGESDLTGLISHSLTVDSEGQPITIVKSSLETLTIIATLYITINTPAQEGVFTAHTERDSLFYKILVSNKSFYPWAVLAVNEGDKFLTLPGSYVTQGCTSPGNLDVKSLNGTANSTGYTYGMSTSRVANTSGNVYNYGNGVEARAIMIPGLCTVNIASNPKSFPKYTLATGDGLKKDFYIKTPRMVLDTEKVYVNGVLKTAGVDYTRNSANARDFPSVAWGSREKYCTKPGFFNMTTQAGGSGYPSPVLKSNWSSDACASYWITNTEPVEFDMGDVVDINTIYQSSGGYGVGTAPVTISYSLDGVIWVTLLGPLWADKLATIKKYTKYIAFSTYVYTYDTFTPTMNDLSLLGHITKYTNSGYGYVMPAITPGAPGTSIVSYNTSGVSTNDPELAAAWATMSTKPITLDARPDDTIPIRASRAGQLPCDHVQARYVKYTNSSTTKQNFDSSSLAWPGLSFGYVAPNISFTIAPPDNAVIEIEYKIPYPFKNSAHVLDWSASLVIGG